MVKTYNINGFTFHLGTSADSLGYVCEMLVDNKFYGAILVKRAGDEIGWNSGIFATAEQATACGEARKIMNRDFGFHWEF